MFAESRMVIETVRKTTTMTTQTMQQQQQQQIFQQQQQQLQQRQVVSADATKVQATGAGLAKAFVNQECSFLVDGSQTGQSNSVLPCHVIPA